MITLAEAKLIRVMFGNGDSIIAPKSDYNKYLEDFKNSPDCLGTCGDRSKVTYQFSDRPDMVFDRAELLKKSVHFGVSLLKSPTCLGMSQVPCTCDFPQAVIAIIPYL